MPWMSMAIPRNILYQKPPFSRLSLVGVSCLPPLTNGRARFRDLSLYLPPGRGRPRGPSCPPLHSLDPHRAAGRPPVQLRVVPHSRCPTPHPAQYLLYLNCPLPYSRKRRTRWFSVRSAKEELACGPLPRRNKTTPFKFQPNPRPQIFLQTVNPQYEQGGSSLSVNSIYSKSTAHTAPMLSNPLLYHPSHHLQHHQPTDTGGLLRPCPTSTSAWAPRGRSRGGARCCRYH